MYLLARIPSRGVLRFVRSVRASIFCISAIAILFATASQAQTSVTLGWNQSTSSVAGYRVYQGIASRVYTTSFDAGKNLQLQINALTPGVTYYFAVAAYTS